MRSFKKTYRSPQKRQTPCQRSFLMTAVCLWLSILPVSRRRIKINGHQRPPAGVRDLMDFALLDEQQGILSNCQAPVIDQCPSGAGYDEQPLLRSRMLILRFAGRLTGLKDHHGGLARACAGQDFEKGSLYAGLDVLHIKSIKNQRGAKNIP